MKKRVQYLDLLKAIAIFWVVFCHFVLLSETVAANIFMAACWMAVPTFFMVNGALLFGRPLQLKKHVKKTVSIYLVLAVWKLLYLLLIPLCMHTPMPEAATGDLFNYLFLFGELPGIINGHLWFIEALLAVYAVFPLFRIVWDWKGDDKGQTADAVKTAESRVDGGPCAADVRAASQGQVSQGQISQGRAGRRLILAFALLSLACTNGLHSLEVAGAMLRAAGLWFPFSFNGVAAFQPFGKYGNMLGFFLLGALLADRSRPLAGSGQRQRLVGAGMLAAALAALWGVKAFLSGQAAWDGILLQEGYRHVPVIFMAVGLFLLCQDVEIRPNWLAAAVQALSKRTLGIFYIHWLFGWLLTNPLAGFLAGQGIAFGIGANLLKNLVLMVPAFLVTLLLEKLPFVKKLVSVG